MNNFGLKIIECYLTKQNPNINPLLKNCDSISTGHSHNYFQYIYVLNDTTTVLNIDNEKLNAQKNCIYLIKPYVLHSFEIHQDPIKMLECKFAVDNSELLNVLNFLPKELKCANNKVYNILTEIAYELKATDFKDSFIYLKLYELILLLNRLNIKNQHASINEKQTTFKKIKQDKFEQLIEYINKNFSDTELNVETLSSIVHLEKTYFSKVFKKTYKLSPIQYLNLIRLQNSLNLLEYTSLNITEIADNVGFKGLIAFNRAFQKTYNISPNNYRIKMKRKIEEKYEKK